ncbi:HU family DNA-binding protein [Alicyclobacillus kakegawensis]|uniref:HU family DNA-binding protein n=1 Tax=Alicyclobacillus kakegawensis TaxID=392012 RepID=UPI000B2CB82E|nr:HU family DNA-binding protein [Alicyclobacillus kakegawensis]
MTKSELVRKVAERTGLSQKDADTAVNAVFASIQEVLARKEKVQITGFGTFEVRERAERRARNPQTGEEITVPAGFAPAFKAGKELKTVVKA